MGSTAARGSHFESLAGKYLRKKGYRLVERNFRFGHKEIDIIALDGETVVFVEVKGRTSREFGLPGESVSRRKMRHIVKTAEAYLSRRKMWNRPCRFDVVCVTLVENREAKFEHIRNAFEA
jgi:putative endonuclease